ncbi:hypothetical protein [Photobacterium chitinilyticum]|uniref:hypothetical protein n=1 Tax=Photobacterium chitinilyticum TaxID=2485123 RepID=UPI001F215BF7|nr:hypothetical protein [Photobacterium chitinilyticum]
MHRAIFSLPASSLLLLRSLLLVSLLVPRLVLASILETSWDWMVSFEHHESRNSLYLPEDQDEQWQSVNALLDVELRYGQWLGVLALKGNDLYSSQSGVESDSEGIVRELFWQGTTSLSGADFDLTLGKARVDWGVGYGYRPLDIIKPYRRNPVGIQVEEGAGVAAVSYFDGNGEWTLIYADSSWASQLGNDLDQQNEQQGIGIRRYGLVGNSEWQGVAYYDDVRRGLLGGSWVSVLDDAWELHASAVYQSEYYSYSLPESLFESVRSEKKNHGLQTLLGLTWTNEIGQSVILEYWYDSRSWNNGQWKQAYQQAEQINGNGMPVGLRYAYAQPLQHVNLVSHNVMLHWTQDPIAWQYWNWSQNVSWLQDFTPTFDVLFSPEDNGVIATQWLRYAAVDTGSMQFDIEIAARILTGDKQSVYRNLSDKRMILLNLKGRF